MEKYEFTRSIRFALKGDIDAFEPKEISDPEDLYENFLDLYVQLIVQFKESVFIDSDNEKVRRKLEVNYKWIRNYAREDYNSLNNEDEKNYTIGDARFLEKIFSEWIIANNELLDNFEDIFSRGEEAQVKRADIALFNKQFLSHDHLSFVREFVQYAKDKDTSRYLKKLWEIIEKIEILAQQIQENVAPSQSDGLEVSRASFNYYTINKISKNFDKDLEGEKEKLKSTFKGRIDYSLLRQVKFDVFVNAYYENVALEELSLQDLYDALKEFKSQQKSAFLEAVRMEDWRQNNQNDEKNPSCQVSKKNVDLEKLKGQKFSGLEALANAAGIEKKKDDTLGYIDAQQNIDLFVQWVIDEYPLFQFNNRNKASVLAQKFIEITNEINKLAEEKNHAKQSNDHKKGNILEKKVRDKRMKRGSYFQGNYFFKEYNDYCNEYKKIAMQRGKIRAQIRSLDQEKIEARLLKYWAHISESDGKKSVLLIPKDGDNLKNAKKYIDNMDGTSSTNVLYSFNSLTVRALDKLARRNIGKDIEKLNDDPIAVYKDLLSGKYPTVSIDSSGFVAELQNVLSREDYTDVEDFRMALEAISYSVEKKNLSDETVDTLKEKYGAKIYTITSYDLERDVASEKEHTILWKSFWEKENERENYSVRINPEVRLSYRQASGDLPLEKSKNRFSKEQLTIAFTLTQNAAKNRIDTAFEENDRLVAITKQFNKDVIDPFVEEKEDELYYYGIDRGNQELASLCVTQFSKEKYEVMMEDGVRKEFDKPLFPEIETYKIKDECLHNKKEITIDRKGNKKEITLIDNPSYFKDDDVFEEIKSPFIDLTTAKLIKGKIILNGDVRTYLALKENNAKRKLFDIYSIIDHDASIEYCATEKHPAWNVTDRRGIFIMRNAFVIKLKGSERNAYQNLCYYHDQLFKYCTKDEIQQKLQQFLDDLRGDKKIEMISIDKINNLRDAITSNMVGIIAHLFERYPGIINLENLQSKKDIDRHFRANNENIARRLEWSLYKKFQKTGLVPPQMRQTVFLRETEGINQFGIIHFIPTEETSTKCPYCFERANNKRSVYEELKFTEHSIRCEKCKFDSRDARSPLEKIKNSDDVASYNIAKSGRA